MHRVAFLNPIANPSQLRTHQQSLTSSFHTLVRGSFHCNRRAFVTSFTSNNTTTNKSTTLMTLENVVIAGGTGFIGTRLAEKLLSQGTAVTILTRNPSSSKIPKGVKAIAWSPTTTTTTTNPGWYESLKNADGIVNLCGQPVVTRWTAKGRESIIRSRVDTTNSLVQALKSISSKESLPSVLINASGVGYYGFDMPYDMIVDETSVKGKDFLAKLCEDWEGAAYESCNALGTRVVIMRLGVVLGANGGALAKMIPAYQLFIGGPLGSGRQWMSWVHVDDVVGSIIKALKDKQMQGAYNCTAPNPVTMNEMCQALATALRRPNLLAVPEIVLKTALGEASCILLEGQRALPKRLKEEGYQFLYEDVNDAMRAIAKEV